VLLGATLLLGACGGGSDGTAATSTRDSSSTTASTTTTVPAALADLPDPAAWLITRPSLGADYRAVAFDPRDHTVEPCGGPPLADLATDARHDRADWLGAVLVTQHVFAFRSPEAASAFLDAARARVAGCSSWKTTVDGEQFTSTRRDVPVRALGDEGFTYEIAMSSAGGKEQGVLDAMFVRRGPNVTSVAVAANGRSAPELERLAGVALQRLP
jgi:hypothetical protein